MRSESWSIFPLLNGLKPNENASSVFWKAKCRRVDLAIQLISIVSLLFDVLSLSFSPPFSPFHKWVLRVLFDVFLDASLPSLSGYSSRYSVDRSYRCPQLCVRVCCCLLCDIHWQQNVSYWILKHFEFRAVTQGFKCHIPANSVTFTDYIYEYCHSHGFYTAPYTSYKRMNATEKLEVFFNNLMTEVLLKNTMSYYKYLPVVFLLQALLIILPNFLLNYTAADTMDFNAIVNDGRGLKKDPERKNAAVMAIKFQDDDYCNVKSSGSLFATKETFFSKKYYFKYVMTKGLILLNVASQGILIYRYLGLKFFIDAFQVSLHRTISNHYPERLHFLKIRILSANR